MGKKSNFALVGLKPEKKHVKNYFFPLIFGRGYQILEKYSDTCLDCQCYQNLNTVLAVYQFPFVGSLLQKMRFCLISPTVFFGTNFFFHIWGPLRVGVVIQAVYFSSMVETKTKA